MYDLIGGRWHGSIDQGCKDVYTNHEYLIGLRTNNPCINRITRVTNRLDRMKSIYAKREHFKTLSNFQIPNYESNLTELESN